MRPGNAGWQVDVLAGGYHRRLVEPAHALLDVPERDEGDALLREAHGLEIGDSELPAEPGGDAAELHRPARSRRRPARSGPRAPRASHGRGPPGCRRAGGAPARASRRPTVRSPAELGEVGRQPGGDPRSATAIAQGPIQAVRVLARAKRDFLVREPPAGPAEALPRLRRLLARERSLEPLACVGPGALRERFVSRPHQIVERLPARRAHFASFTS